MKIKNVTVFGSAVLGAQIAFRAGLAAVLEFIMSSPELQPNKITDDEVKNKSSIELRLTEPMLIANKKMRIYSSASIAANPMLYAAVPLLSALSYC